MLYSLGNIYIADDSVLSQKAYLCAASHDYKSRSFDILSSDIRIGSEVWIATDVFVGPGVTIGGGAVVGARSSVFEDLPGGMLYFGSPAKAVRPRATQPP